MGSRPQIFVNLEKIPQAVANTDNAVHGFLPGLLNNDKLFYRVLGYEADMRVSIKQMHTTSNLKKYSRLTLFPAMTPKITHGTQAVNRIFGSIFGTRIFGGGLTKPPNHANNGAYRISSRTNKAKKEGCCAGIQI
jgi:hypothetical protein